MSRAPHPDPQAAPHRLPHPRTGALFASPVRPGTGWPGDLAVPTTPVATTAPGVARLAATADLSDLTTSSSVCRACPRLVTWREDVATAKRLAFRAEPYWGRPVPGFGDEAPRLLVVGLAPAAHGGNRTGRVFTGDRSGDWIFAALHRAGLASQAESVDAADGLRLVGVRIVAAVRCAPPGNAPTPAERDTCAGWLRREVELTNARAVLALGAFGWAAFLGAARALGWHVPPPAPRFGHRASVALTRPDDVVVHLVGSYHVSQQNTQTGRLTERMLDAAIADALGAADRAEPPGRMRAQPS